MGSSFTYSIIIDCKIMEHMVIENCTQLCFWLLLFVHNGLCNSLAWSILCRKTCIRMQFVISWFSTSERKMEWKMGDFCASFHPLHSPLVTCVIVILSVWIFVTHLSVILNLCSYLVTASRFSTQICTRKTCFYVYKNLIWSLMNQKLWGEWWLTILKILNRLQVPRASAIKGQRPCGDPGGQVFWFGMMDFESDFLALSKGIMQHGNMQMMLESDLTIWPKWCHQAEHVISQIRIFDWYMLYIYQDFRGSTFTLESVNSIIVRTNYWSVFFMYSKMTTIPPTLLLVVRYMPLIFTIPCLSFLAQCGSLSSVF